MRPKNHSVLEVPRWYFYDLGTLLRKNFTNLWKTLNTHHPSITVKAELSSESMHFLDTVVYKGNRFKETGTFDTKVYFKPTDTLELLHKKSHHPNHTFKGLIKSQILRYVRICNNKQDVMIACRKLFAALVRRGYSERFLRKIKDKTLCELRKRDLLKDALLGTVNYVWHK